MQLNSCIEKIEKHIHRGSSKPIFVNLNNSQDVKELIDHFNVGGNKIVNVASNDQIDELPTLDAILGLIHDRDETIFITGISSFARLMGQSQFASILNQIINSQSVSKAIVLLYQCEDILHDIISKDPRIDSHIFFIDGDKQTLPKIIFVKENVAKTLAQPIIIGMSALIKEVEYTDKKVLYVKSHFKKSNFTESIYYIEELNSYFEAVKLDYVPELTSSDEELLNEKLWRMIAIGCHRNGGLKEYFCSEIGDIQNIDLIISSWPVLNEAKKALLFLLLKTHSNLSKNKIFNIAITNTKSMDDLVYEVYKSILQFNLKDKNYWEIYEERYQLLKVIGISEHTANKFCLIAEEFEEEALNYLTNLTTVERKLTIKLISVFHKKIDEKKLKDILQHTYPELYQYLLPYDYGKSELNSYFNTYKKLKVENYITREFYTRVEEEAKERNYNLILPTRSEKLSSLQKQKSILYFVDALGVEYLSYIAQRASNLKLMMNTIICHSELPSITSLNKEFIEYFNAAGTIVYDDIKNLDKIKHSGKKEYNFETSPYPTYLADELSFIDEIIEKANAKLDGGYERVFIISDHGASRLAVIGRRETKWEMRNKGEHCGRCCKVSDDVIDEPNEYMTQENGYWVLANYDIIKGGRPGTVEVHGGASLEEVCIPIIELTRMPEDINIEVLTKIIQTGYKIKPILKFVSNHLLNNVNVLIGDKRYTAVTTDGKHFEVELKGFNREKEYSFIVLSNNNHIVKDLKFKIKTAGMSDNDLL